MKNSQPDWESALWGFWNKKARLGKVIIHKSTKCCVQLGWQNIEMKWFSQGQAGSVKHSWSAVQYLTSPPWLSPCANRDTTNTARASTAPADTLCCHTTCHMPGHHRHAEKFISFQAHNSFYVRLITLLHLQAKFRIKPPNSFLIVSLNEESHTGHLNQHTLYLLPVLS